MPKSVVFAIVASCLFPFVVLAMMFAGMITHISYTSLKHRTGWHPTTATVLRAEMLCKITYQPDGAILREVVARGPCDEIRNTPLPTSGRKPKVEEDLYGELTYDVDGSRRNWKGELADAGIYKGIAGQTINLFYDPAAPDSIDTAEYKGWLGGMLIWGASVGFVGLYIWLLWFLWPNRRRPPSSPSNSRGILVSAARAVPGRAGRPFGRA